MNDERDTIASGIAVIIIIGRLSVCLKGENKFEGKQKKSKRKVKTK